MSLKVVTNIALKILIVLVTLPIMNFVYTRWFWMDDLRKHAETLPDLLEAQDSCEILYFGESSNFSFNPEKDSLKDRISDFIGYHFNGIHLGTINNSAYHAGIFLPLIKHIDINSRVKTLIVTLNMRTFDQACIHSELETALQKKAVMYEPRPALLNRLLLSLNAYDDRSLKERDLIMWKSWTYDTLRSAVVQFPYPTIKSWCAAEKFPLPGGGEDMKKRELADHYIKAYAFHIDTMNNPRIADFDAIARFAQSRGYTLVLNLLAENTHYADSLVGENLVWLMRRNRDILVKRYTAMRAIVVDNLEVVPPDDYTDLHWTTEHYGQLGRQIIASRVAKALKERYPKNYRDRPIIRSPLN